MKAINRFKDFFLDKDYFVSFYKNHIYIINYKKIIDFSDSKLLISFESFKLSIKGYNFRINRKNNYEIDLFGLFSSVEIIND